MDKIENGWTQMKETYDGVLMDMRAVAGERVLFQRRLKQAEKMIVQLRHERDYWHNTATRGGG